MINPFDLHALLIYTLLDTPTTHSAACLSFLHSGNMAYSQQQVTPSEEIVAADVLMNLNVQGSLVTHSRGVISS